MTILDELKQLSTYMSELEGEIMICFNHAVDILTIMDLNAIIIKINPACETLLGHSVESLMGKSLKMVVHPDDIPLIEKSLGILRDQAINKLLLRMRTSNSEYKLISWSVSKVYNGKIGATGRDVTEVYDRIARLEEEINALKHE